jgi:mRNA-degrading endonuclease RelE of RelBE toxin-antitoxin system
VRDDCRRPLDSVAHTKTVAPYAIDTVRSALDEIKAVKPFYRQQIRDAIRQQLMHQPTVETRNRKPLSGAKPDFEHVPPLWQLRVGHFRIFCDVNEESRLVSIRAVREKRLHTTTEEII